MEWLFGHQPTPEEIFKQNPDFIKPFVTFITVLLEYYLHFPCSAFDVALPCVFQGILPLLPSILTLKNGTQMAWTSVYSRHTVNFKHETFEKHVQADYIVASFRQINGASSSETTDDEQLSLVWEEFQRIFRYTCPSPLFVPANALPVKFHARCETAMILKGCECRIVHYTTEHVLSSTHLLAPFTYEKKVNGWVECKWNYWRLPQLFNKKND